MFPSHANHCCHRFVLGSNATTTMEASILIFWFVISGTPPVRLHFQPLTSEVTGRQRQAVSCCLLTAHGSWVARISSLKSGSSIMPTSDGQRFQPGPKILSAFQNQSQEAGGRDEAPKNHKRRARRKEESRRMKTLETPPGVVSSMDMFSLYSRLSLVRVYLNAVVHSG